MIGGFAFSQSEKYVLYIFYMMEKSCRANHMNRLNSSSCSIESGVIYLDIISNLERVSDHAVNIAQQVIAGRIVNK